MSTTALRPLLRTSHLTVRPTPTTTPTSCTHRPHLPAHPTMQTQTRHANLIRRPKRPWLNDQLVILSDGSAYTQLTTSPKGIIRSTKDVRNHPLWNPSVHKLMDVEEDEAGRLKAFREKFGRGWDAGVGVEAAGEAEAGKVVDQKEVGKGEGVGHGLVDGDGVGAGGQPPQQPQEDNLMDLIRQGYDQMVARGPGGKVKRKKVEDAPPAAAAPAAQEGKKKKK